MALVRLKPQRVPNVVKKNTLVQHVRKMVKQFILHDLKDMFQPGQASAPLVIAVALGTILSFIPAPVLDSLLVGVILARYRQVNRPALLAARIVWNDLIVVPLYVPGFRFGMRLLASLSINDTAPAIKVFAFAVGVVALASAAAIVSALMMFSLAAILQQRQRILLIISGNFWREP